MKLKKNMARLLSLVLVMGTLAGCSNTSSSDSDNKTKSAVEQRKENNELYNLSTLINYQTKSLKEELDKRKRTNMLKY